MYVNVFGLWLFFLGYLGGGMVGLNRFKVAFSPYLIQLPFEIKCLNQKHYNCLISYGALILGLV